MICIVDEYIVQGGRRRRSILAGVVMGKLVVGVLRTRLATHLFGLECLFGEVTRGVMRLIAMSFLAVADTCCRVGEGFNTVRALVSKFAVGTSK
jgi:hypothetical protein